MKRYITIILILAAISCHPYLTIRNNNVLGWSPDGLDFNDTLSESIKNDLECRIWTNDHTFGKNEEPKLGISIINHSKYNIVLPSGFSFVRGVPQVDIQVLDSHGTQLAPTPFIMCGNMDCVDSTYYRRVGPGQEIILFDFSYQPFPPILRPDITSTNRPVTVKLRIEYTSAKSDTLFWYNSTYVMRWTGLQYENSRPELADMIPPGQQDLIDRVPRVKLLSNEIEIVFK